MIVTIKNFKKEISALEKKKREIQETIDTLQAGVNNLQSTCDHAPIVEDNVFICSKCDKYLGHQV